MKAHKFQITPAAAAYINETLLQRHALGGAYVFALAPMGPSSYLGEDVDALMRLTGSQRVTLAERELSKLGANFPVEWVPGAIRRDRVPSGSVQVIDSVECFIPADLSLVLDGHVLHYDAGDLRFAPPLQPVR